MKEKQEHAAGRDCHATTCRAFIEKTERSKPQHALSMSRHKGGGALVEFCGYAAI